VTVESHFPVRACVWACVGVCVHMPTVCVSVLTNLCVWAWLMRLLLCVSGGQKARVSLARAMYAQADVYILDDPTAAVDAWVGQHLFTKCINGALRGKTRVYITNHIEQAEHADIVVMMEHGRIVDQGTYEELCARSAPFQALLDAYRSEDRGDSKEEPTSDAVPGDVAGVVAEDVEVAVEVCWFRTALPPRARFSGDRSVLFCVW